MLTADTDGYVLSCAPSPAIDEESCSGVNGIVTNYCGTDLCNDHNPIKCYRGIVNPTSTVKLDPISETLCLPDWCGASEYKTCQVLIKGKKMQ